MCEAPPPPDPLPPPAAPEAAPVRSRFARREQAAADALRALIRDAVLDRHAQLPPNHQPFELTLRLRVDPGANWQLVFSPALGDQAVAQLDDVMAERDVYRPGAVYNFKAHSSQAAGCTPPAPTAVFSGYDSTGVPRWLDLPQILIEAGDERIDQLYSKRPVILSRVQLGGDLKKDQLKAFGRSSRTYALLGQVTTGFFQLPGTVGDRRLAITFQVVETRARDHGLRLHLNLLAGLDPGRLADLFSEGWEPGVARAVRSAQRDLQTLEQRVQRARETGSSGDVPQAMRAVPGILHRLARSLERAHQQARRRTRHAERRREDQRPVDKALEDARRARAEQMHFDEKTRTWIVCRDSRAHAFADDGRHVTSFLMAPKSVEFRVRTRRWRPVTAEEAERLRAAFRAGPSSAPPPDEA